MKAMDQFDPYYYGWIAYTYQQIGNSELAISYLDEVIQFWENYSGATLDRAYYLVLLYALKDDDVKMYEYLKLINQDEGYYIELILMRDHVFLERFRNDPEFLRIIGEIEEKYEVRHERDRKWLVEHDML
jgi:tetratricopeptide (TPR) repeat protein